jgi:predicted NAD/FAD-binding protein
VTVYEQADYVGGHSNTVQIDVAEKSMPVDTGFIVYNPLNYPNLVELFEHLNVPTKPSDMSFSVSIGNGNLEYSGTNLDGLLAQRRNLIRPRFLRMVKDLLRFYGQAQELTADDTLSGMSLGQFLRANRYSDAFLADHLMPMGAAIWSSSVEQMMQFPALSFLRFFNNLGLLQLKERPERRTVDCASREYKASLGTSTVAIALLEFHAKTGSRPSRLQAGGAKNMITSYSPAILTGRSAYWRTQPHRKPVCLGGSITSRTRLCFTRMSR